MMQTFDILAHIVVKHSYYNRKPFHEFSYTPTANTERIMRQNDLLHVQTHGRNQLAVSSTRNETLSLHGSVKEDFSLIFFVDTPNIHLENITQFPRRGNHEVVLFTNLNQSTNNDNVYELHKNQTVELVTHSLVIETKEWVTDTIVNSYGQAQNVVPRKVGNQTFFDISGLEEDIFGIQTQNGIRYFTNVQLGFRKKPLAIFHICGNETLLKGRELRQPQYSISMQAILPLWQYIFPTSKMDRYMVENLFIEMSDNSVIFRRDETTPDANQISFTSQKPIPIEDKKATRFHLKQLGGADTNASILLPDLPYPRQETLVIRNDENHVYPIYINM